MEILADIRIVITVVAGLIGLYLLFRNKSLVSHKIQVDFGLSSDLRKYLPIRFRRRPISLVAIGVPDPQSGEEVLCTIPCLIENNRPHALNKVTLQFEYPFGFQPPSQEEVGEKFANEIRILDAEDFSQPHTVQNYLQSRRDFDLVRPGEHLGIGEPMRVRPFSAAIVEDKPAGCHVQMLSKLLAQEEPIVSICPVRLFVFSQELSKTRHDVLVIWVDSNDMDELSENLDKIAKSLWKTAFGDQRWFLKFPWEKINVDCLTLMIQPKYVVSAKHNSRLMDGNMTLDQMSVGVTRIPFQRPFGDLHSF